MKKGQRAYGKNDIYVDNVVLYARHKPLSLPSSQEDASLSENNSSISLEGETLKAESIQETLTTETLADASTLATKADIFTTDITAGASTKESTADLSFALEMSVSEWRSDCVGNGGKVLRKRVIREFDIEELDNFEALFNSLVYQSNFDGKKFPEMDHIAERLKKAFDSAAGYYREKTVNFLLDPDLFKDDTLPSHVISQALLWLRYARALRRTSACISKKEKSHWRNANCS
jgi:hypothetical protein